MTEPTRLETEDLQVDDDLEVTDGPDPLTDGVGPADAETVSEPVDGKGPDVEVPITPDPSQAEIQAKTGDALDLSVPKSPTIELAPAMTSERAKEQYEMLNTEYGEVCNAKAACEVRMTELNRLMQVLKPHFTNKVDPQDNQRGIIHYIKVQNDIRKTKAMRINEVLKGLKIHDVLPSKGSKLDQSMTRKRGFGLQRPSYPVAKK